MCIVISNIINMSEEVKDWCSIIKSKSLQPDEVDYIIYHSPCSDGTGSGLIAWKYLTNKFPDRKIKYYPANINAYPPPDLEGRNVLICDYSYKKDILLEIIKKAKNLLIIDHHKSAQKDLVEISDKYKIFDMNHSGAMLTWFYFYNNIPAPLLIKYIEDRDIWAKKLDLVDEFVSWFYTLPHDFNEYNKYLDDNLLMEMVKTKGVNFLELNNNYINQALEYVVIKFNKIKDKYYFIGYINSTVLKSDIGNKIFDKFPLINFSAIYSINDYDNSTTYSLRSNEISTDVSEISTLLNGGGHRNASGNKVFYIVNHLGINYDNNSQLYTLLDYIYFDRIELNNNNKLDIVYLNTNIYKYELSAYLLQKRYTNNNNKDIQEATHLYQTKNTIINNNKEINEFHVCAIWDYNVNLDTTCYLVLFSNSYNKELKKQFLSKYPCVEDDMNKKYYTFKMKGFIKILN